MKKKVAVLLALCVATAAFAGCSSFPPTTGGVPIFNHEGATLWRSWKQDLSGVQKFTDKYLFNYDYDDPFNE